jgi:hypothetical protein
MALYGNLWKSVYSESDSVLGDEVVQATRKVGNKKEIKQ